MAAPTENEFYKLRLDLSNDGKKISVKQLAIKCQEYIDFCLENPLMEVDFKGKDATEVKMPKMRAMNIMGLCHWLGIVTATWYGWKKEDKYLSVITRVEQIFYNQKFQGAAAGMLNPNIIARDLGLRDHTQMNVQDDRKKAADLFPDELDAEES